jgi:hypothetical protein
MKTSGSGYTFWNMLPTDPEVLKEMLKSEYLYTPYVPLQVTDAFHPDAPTRSSTMTDVVENDASLIKLIKTLPTGFKEECDSMTEKQLRDCVVESTHNLETAVSELKEKIEYKVAKEEWKKLNEPIRDIKKAQKGKVKYCFHRLEGLGKI